MQVAHERPDLQEQAATLVRQLASYTITLTELEDNLLRRLAASQVLCHPWSCPAAASRACSESLMHGFCQQM